MDMGILSVADSILADAVFGSKSTKGLSSSAPISQIWYQDKNITTICNLTYKIIFIRYGVQFYGICRQKKRIERSPRLSAAVARRLDKHPFSDYLADKRFPSFRR
jgi:hypothetical protein